MFFKLLRLFFITILISSAAVADEMVFAKSKLQIITKNGKHEFIVEVADTPQKLEHGLMFRNNMPEKNGMVFLFAKAQEVNMWMKDTYIPLDMVFIKPGGKIWKVVKNAKPESLETISSSGKIIAALELNAGICEKLGIGENDKIVLQGLK